MDAGCQYGNMYWMNLARERTRENGIDKIRYKAQRDSKKILELSKELSKEISSHLEPLEPKGMHPLVRKREINMEGMKKNYKSCSEIEEDEECGVGKLLRF